MRKRQHKRWQNKQKKYHQTSQDISAKILIFGLLIWSAIIALHGKSQNIYNNSLENYGLNNLNNKLSQKVWQVSDDDKNIEPTSIGSIDDFRNINFTQIDKDASSINYQGTSVAELATLLSSHATTEAEKARIIYSWIADNITYDVPAYLSGTYGDLRPEGVLKSRKAVCSGYANLYKALARAMGLDVVVVEGAAKGDGYIIGNATRINHAWNAIKINNRWYLADPTWGAGYVNNQQFNQKFDPYYFATPPEQFIFSHLPTQSKWQLLAKQYTTQQFDTSPRIYPEFFKNNLQLVSHFNSVIEAKSRFQVILLAPKDITAIARIKSGSSYLNDTYTLVQRKNNNIIVAASPPSGSYELEIFCKDKHIPGAYHPAVSYKVISNSAGEEFPLTYSTFSEKNSYLYAPLDKYLPTNNSVDFRIEVPDALEVQVIDKSSNSWVQLTRSGNTFTANIPVSSNKIQVVAKFPENQNYWNLVEYNQ